MNQEYKMESGSSPKLGGENVYSANEPGDSSLSVRISIGERVDSMLGADEDQSYLMMVDSMLERVGKLSDIHNEWSIYKVPSRLCELNEDAYAPRIVSIGPLHFGKENLRAMDVHKTRYMKSIFQRTIDEDLTFYSCVRAILSMEERARSCYNGYDSFFPDSRRLSEILLVDGCFILELFLRWTFSSNSTEISGDPIFGAATICSLQRDLALLENQIPFFVLEGLFEIVMGRYGDHELRVDQIPLNQLCASFFYLEQNLTKPSSGYRHLLDLIRNCYLPRKYLEIKQVEIELTLVNCCTTRPLDLKKSSRKTKSNAAPCSCCGMSIPMTKQRRKQSWELIHCVTKLRESGIKFAKGNSENLFDIKFSPKGVLEIPKLCIDDTMDSLLRNMIAFEQCCHGTTYDITSYAVLMDCLIDSPGDAEFLQQKRIIANYLGHGEEVSNIFNKIPRKYLWKTSTLMLCANK